MANKIYPQIEYAVSGDKPGEATRIDLLATLRVQGVQDKKWYLIYIRKSFNGNMNSPYVVMDSVSSFIKEVYFHELCSDPEKGVNMLSDGLPIAKLDEDQQSEFDRIKNLTINGDI